MKQSLISTEEGSGEALEDIMLLLTVIGEEEADFSKAIGLALGKLWLPARVARDYRMVSD